MWYHPTRLGGLERLVYTPATRAEHDAHPAGDLRRPRAAHLLGSLFAAFKQPALIGGLLAGAILGPAFLGIVHQAEFLEALGQLGMMLLLFVAGLETHVGRFVEAGPRAARVAALGAVVPFAGGRRRRAGVPLRRHELFPRPLTGCL
jgi:hypothetical protein